VIKGWPDIEQFTAKLAAMDRHSSNASPGRLGFQQTTFHGNLPQKNDWCDTWEESFVQATRLSLRLYEAKNTCPELQGLSDLMFEKVSLGYLSLWSWV
jgi:protein-ribulosamine 3-kinase